MKTNFPIFATIMAILAAGLSASTASAETYSYDTNGRLTMADYGNGQRIFYTYDLNGNLTRRNVVSFVDSDNDGMDDNWEMTYFSTLARTGTGDFDDDGMSDAAEFLAGTNPASGSSVFKVTTVNGVCTLTWSSISGKNYRVQYKNNLTDASWFDLPGDVTASGVTSSKTDSPPAGQNQRSYRVVLLP